MGIFSQRIVLLALLGGGSIVAFIWLMHFKDKLGLHWWSALLLSLLHSVVGVLCTLIFGFLETGFDPSSFGNLSLYGGAFFMPLFYWLTAIILKKKPGLVFDIFTICLIETLFFARINCLIKGCCYGIPFFGSRTLLWPTRELELMFYVILAFLLGRRALRDPGTGLSYPTYLISYGTFRFVTEWARHTDSSALIHRGHIWSLLALCIGISFYFTISTRQKEGKRKPNIKKKARG